MNNPGVDSGKVAAGVDHDTGQTLLEQKVQNGSDSGIDSEGAEELIPATSPQSLGQFSTRRWAVQLWG